MNNIDTSLIARFHPSIDQIDAATWDALRVDANPFVSHAFLHALEDTDCIRAGWGWQAHHLGLYDDNRLVAAAPLYLKGNSHGEFVFDWGWARAWERAGGEYYPKLLNAVPYSPVPGPRLLAGDGERSPILREGLVRAMRTEAMRMGLSSVHANFLLSSELGAFGDDWLARSDVQFHWHNHGYRHFPDFLAALSHKKRKNILRERAQVAASGLLIEWRSGDTLNDHEWERVHALYEATFDAKGNQAVLTAAFFRRLGELGTLAQVALARHEGEIVAIALFLQGDGVLYGRGAADMKGSVAAMVVALEDFVAAHPRHAGRVALLLTSDEEGAAMDGVRRVAETFRARKERIDWCVVGEPSAKKQLGDLIRVGRRGSLSATLTVRGVQGHIAYPKAGTNPIHNLAPALTELINTHWDDGNADFPPTSLQFSNINAGTGANNVIPGILEALFNFRYSTASTESGLKQSTAEILDRYGLDWHVDWHDSGQPFLAPPDGTLRQTVIEVCRQLTGIDPEQSTGGGTSDGRFIAPLGVEVIELGPVNATIHKIDECVSVADLEQLAGLYQAMCARLLG